MSRRLRQTIQKKDKRKSMKRKSMKRKSMKRKSMKRKSMKHKSMKHKSMKHGVRSYHHKYLSGGANEGGATAESEEAATEAAARRDKDQADTLRERIRTLNSARAQRHEKELSALHQDAASGAEAGTAAVSSVTGSSAAEQVEPPKCQDVISLEEYGVNEYLANDAKNFVVVYETKEGLGDTLYGQNLDTCVEMQASFPPNLTMYDPGQQLFSIDAFPKKNITLIAGRNIVVKKPEWWDRPAEMPPSKCFKLVPAYDSDDEKKVLVELMITMAEVFNRDEYIPANAVHLREELSAMNLQQLSNHIADALEVNGHDARAVLSLAYTETERLSNPMYSAIQWLIDGWRSDKNNLPPILYKLVPLEYMEELFPEGCKEAKLVVEGIIREVVEAKRNSSSPEDLKKAVDKLDDAKVVYQSKCGSQWPADAKKERRELEKAENKAENKAEAEAEKQRKRRERRAMREVLDLGEKLISSLSFEWQGETRSPAINLTLGNGSFIKDSFIREGQWSLEVRVVILVQLKQILSLLMKNGEKDVIASRINEAIRQSNLREAINACEELLDLFPRVVPSEPPPEKNEIIYKLCRNFLLTILGEGVRKYIGKFNRALVLRWAGLPDDASDSDVVAAEKAMAAEEARAAQGNKSWWQRMLSGGGK